MIQTEYAKCAEGEFRHSKDLFKLPKKAKTAVYQGKNMVINLSYIGKNRLLDYSTIRTYFGHKLLAKSSAGKYDPKKNLPLFFKPDKKIGHQDIFNVYRYRYEGTKYSPEEAGRDDVRLIATEAAYSVHILEVNSKIDAHLSSTIWATMSSAEHTIFLPYNNLISKVDKKYSAIEDNTKYFGTKKMPKDSENNDILYSENIAHIYFKRLNSLAGDNRKLYSKGIRDYWQKQEKQLISDYQKIYKQACVLYDKNKNSAKKLLTDFSINVQKEALADADSMFKELM